MQLLKNMNREKMETNYFVRYSNDITKTIFWSSENPSTGLERYKVACNILKNNKNVFDVSWETPSQMKNWMGGGSGIQNRSENYSPD